MDIWGKVCKFISFWRRARLLFKSSLLEWTFIRGRNEAEGQEGVDLNLLNVLFFGESLT